MVAICSGSFQPAILIFSPARGGGDLLLMAGRSGIGRLASSSCQPSDICIDDIERGLFARLPMSFISMTNFPDC